MIKQKIKVIFGINDIENRINNVIKEENANGWKLTSINAHASNHSMWTLLFEKVKEDKPNADEFK